MPYCAPVYRKYWRQGIVDYENQSVVKDMFTEYRMEN